MTTKPVEQNIGQRIKLIEQNTIQRGVGGKDVSTLRNKTFDDGVSRGRTARTGVTRLRVRYTPSVGSREGGREGE